jgi:hypothetical protein
MKCRPLNKKIKNGTVSALYIFSFLIYFSCNDKTVVIPDSVLPQDTMAAVLVDMQILEALKVKAGITDSLSRDSMLVEYALIFKKHHMNQEQFEQSLDFYKANPRLLEGIYDKTINELSRLQAMLGNINTAIADSIKKSKGGPAQHKPGKNALVPKAGNEAKKKPAGEKNGKTKEGQSPKPATKAK